MPRLEIRVPAWGAFLIARNRTEKNSARWIRGAFPFFRLLPPKESVCHKFYWFSKRSGPTSSFEGGSKSRRARPGGGQLWAIPEAEVPKTRQNCGNTGNNSQIQCYGPKYSATGQSTMLPPAAPCGKIALDRGDRISRPRPRRFGHFWANGQLPIPPRLPKYYMRQTGDYTANAQTGHFSAAIARRNM